MQMTLNGFLLFAMNQRQMKRLELEPGLGACMESRDIKHLPEKKNSGQRTP